MTDSLIERMTEIAHRDSAVSVTVRADDLRVLLSKLRAPVADERISLRGAANLAFNALHECKPAKGAEKQYSDAIQALQSALHDIAYTVNRTATPQQFADHLQREARAALASAPVAGEADNTDYIGLALELENAAKRVESQTVQRAIEAGAHGLRLANSFRNAAPQASEAVRDQALAALESAQRFIRNGIEFGYVRMPDADTPDPAHRTPDLIDAAIRALSAQPGAQRTGGSDAE